MKSINVNFNIKGCVNINVPDDMVNDSDIYDALMEWYYTAAQDDIVESFLEYGNDIELNGYYVDE